MNIAHSKDVFSAEGTATLSPFPTVLPQGRIPLNDAAARVAYTLKRRIVSAGLLSAMARLGDFAALSLSSIAIFLLYVPVEDQSARYLAAALLLSLGTVGLIGSFS